VGDRIELRGLRAVGVHGVLPEERTRPQPFEVDLDVEADLREAGQTDDLGRTIDYGLLATTVEGVVASERFALLERLAERIAEAVLACPAGVPIERVTVTVRKLRPPVPVDLAVAGVRIVRP
jgi:dihydroneopterin aldolase